MKGLTSTSPCALISLPAAADDGRVAQLGERIVRNDEVAGSIPVASTIRRVGLISAVLKSFRSPAPVVLEWREPVKRPGVPGGCN